MDDDLMTMPEAELDFPANFEGMTSDEEAASFGGGADEKEATSQAAQEPDYRKLYEDLEVKQAQAEARFAQYQSYMQEELGRLRTPPPQHVQHTQQQQQEQQWTDPYTAMLHRKTSELEQGFRNHINQLETGISASVRQAQGAALKSILNEFPDLHEYIPQERIKSAFEEAIRTRRFNLDWESELKQGYFMAAGPTLAKKAREQANELAVKRDEKAKKDLKAAQSVAPGGTRFQQPQAPTLKKGQRGTRDAREAFLAALEQAGGVG